jgi:hypothetical protein
MDLELLKKQKEELLQEITERGYESLRYSLLENEAIHKKEWETRIDFEDEKYFVYATMDRASYNRKNEFENFDEAKECFLKKMDLSVRINRRSVEDGEESEYPSPLWDK